MHRPGIASVSGDRIILDGTTVEELERYHAARDKLGLVLVDATGRQLATSGIHIADYTEEHGGGTLQLEVLVSDDEFWGA